MSEGLIFHFVSKPSFGISVRLSEMSNRCFENLGKVKTSPTVSSEVVFESTLHAHLFSASVQCKNLSFPDRFLEDEDDAS